MVHQGKYRGSAQSDIKIIVNHFGQSYSDLKTSTWMKQGKAQLPKIPNCLAYLDISKGQLHL